MVWCIYSSKVGKKGGYNMKKRLLSIILSCVMLLQLLPIVTLATGTSSGQQIEVGQHVAMGKKDGRDLTWEILAIEDGKALLFSNYVLDFITIAKRKSANFNYCNSELFDWCQNLYSTSFTEAEKDSIYNLFFLNKTDCAQFVKTKRMLWPGLSGTNRGPQGYGTTYVATENLCFIWLSSSTRGQWVDIFGWDGEELSFGTCINLTMYSVTEGACPAITLELDKVEFVGKGSFDSPYTLRYGNGGTGNGTESGPVEIKSFHPSNGQKDVDSTNLTPYLYYDRDVSHQSGKSVDLDFSKAPFTVYQAEDNKVIYQAKEDASLRGTSSDIKIRAADHVVFFSGCTFEPGKTYYITMGEGFIKMADGTVSPEIKKGDWEFTTEVVSFVLGRDNNSFSHSGRGKEDGFYKVKNYKIPEALYNNLIQGLSDGNINEIKKEMNSKFRGSCYGIASTICLSYNGAIALSDITDANVLNYYDIGLPYKEEKLLNSIQYYMLAQYRDDIWPSSFVVKGEWGSFDRQLPHMIEWLKQEPFVLTYNYYDYTTKENSGHALIAYESGQYESGAYYINLYDVNSASKNECIKMWISEDYKSFNFVDKNDHLISNETCLFMGVFRSGDLYSTKPGARLSGNANTTIMIPAEAEVSLKSESGDTLFYNNGGFSGTLSIESIKMVTGDDTDVWKVSVPEIKRFELSSPQKDLNIDVYTKDEFVSIAGSGIADADVQMGESVVINSQKTDKYDFAVYMSTEEEISQGESNLISISGTANDTVQVHYDSGKKQINVRSTEAIVGTEVWSYSGTEAISLVDQNTTSNEVTVTTDPSTQLPFADVTEKDWFYNDVKYVYENGLMNGVGEGLFGPSGTTTRGMIVTILYRLEGEPSAALAAFQDVASNQWYAKAVGWAADNGIVTGYSSSQFGPNDKITREQMAAILYRYAAYKGYDVSQRADLSKYEDQGTISSYAVDSMAWANGEGLINGIDADTLNPKGSAIRAQVAAILHRFCENIA